MAFGSGPEEHCDVGIFLWARRGGFLLPTTSYKCIVSLLLFASLWVKWRAEFQENGSFASQKLSETIFTACQMRSGGL